MLEFPCDVERLPNGNTIITDAGDETGAGSEVIEVDLLGNVIWVYNEGLCFAHSAKRISNGNTLITDTTHDRVIEVNPAKDIVFTSDQWADNTGILSDGTHLHYPNDAHELKDGTFIITDRNNNRCVIVNRAGEMLWEYSENISHPHNCDMCDNGNVLIADSDGCKVIEVDKDKNIVWQWGDSSVLDWPRDADRMPNGNTLIGNSRASRLIEVDPQNNVVWEFQLPYFGNIYDADPLPNGNVIFSDQQRHQVVEIDRFGDIVWQFKNYRNLNEINNNLKNGSFKKVKSDGTPESWTVFKRFSEGGGEFSYDSDVYSKPVPKLVFDRAGAFFLSQQVVAKPGMNYKLCASVMTKGLDENAFAYIQVAFIDQYGALMQDASVAPKGQFFTGDNEWTEDIMYAQAPEGSHVAEIRLVISGSGTAWFRGVMFIAD